MDSTHMYDEIMRSGELDLKCGWLLMIGKDKDHDFQYATTL